MSSANQGGSRYGSGTRSKSGDHAGELSKQATADDLNGRDIEKHSFWESVTGHNQLMIIFIILSVLGCIFAGYLFKKLWKKYIRKIPIIRRIMSRLLFKKGKVVPHVHKHTKQDGIAGEGHGHSHGGGGHAHGEPKAHGHGHAHGEPKAHGHGHAHDEPKAHGHGHAHGGAAKVEKDDHGHGHGHGDSEKKTEELPTEHGGLGETVKVDIENIADEEGLTMKVDKDDIREILVRGQALTISMKVMKCIEGSKLKEMFEEDLCPHDAIIIDREFDSFYSMYQYLESDSKVVPKLTQLKMEKFGKELKFWSIPVPTKLMVNAIIVELGNFVGEEQEEVCFGHGHSHGDENEILDIVYSDELGSLDSADGDQAMQMKQYRMEEQKLMQKLKLQKDTLTAAQQDELQKKIEAVQIKLGKDPRVLREEEGMYVPVFKSVDRVEKVGGQFVGNTAMSVEQVNKLRREEADAALLAKVGSKYAKFNNKMQIEKQKERERQIAYEVAYKKELQDKKAKQDEIMQQKMEKAALAGKRGELAKHQTILKTSNDIKRIQPSVNNIELQENPKDTNFLSKDVPSSSVGKEKLELPKKVFIEDQATVMPQRQPTFNPDNSFDEDDDIQPGSSRKLLTDSAQMAIRALQEKSHGRTQPQLSAQGQLSRPQFQNTQKMSIRADIAPLTDIQNPLKLQAKSGKKKKKTKKKPVQPSQQS